MFNTSLGEVFNTSAKPSVLFHTSTARALRAQPSLDPYRFLWYPNFFSRALARARPSLPPVPFLPSPHINLNLRSLWAEGGGEVCAQKGGSHGLTATLSCSS